MPMNAICLRKRVAFIAVGKNSNTTSPKHKVKLKYMNEVQPYSISLKECEYFFNIWYKITTKYMSCIKKSLITVKTLFHYDGWLWKINDIRSFYLSLSSTVDNICKIIYIMQNLNLECNMKVDLFAKIFVLAQKLSWKLKLVYIFFFHDQCFLSFSIPSSILLWNL